MKMGVCTINFGITGASQTPPICTRFNDHISLSWQISPKRLPARPQRYHNPQHQGPPEELTEEKTARQCVLLHPRTAPVSCPTIVLLRVLQAVQELHVSAPPPRGGAAAVDPRQLEDAGRRLPWASGRTVWHWRRRRSPWQWRRHAREPWRW